MEKNAPLIGIIIAVLALGGIILYAAKKSPSSPSTTSTSTPTTQTSTTQTTTTTTTTASATAPTVTTNTNTVPSDTTAVVTGAVTPNGAFTTYWYEYGLTQNFGKKTSNQIVGSGYSSIPAPGYITGLEKDTTYYFRLVAENRVGKVIGAQYAFQTTHGNPPPVGGSPTAKTLTASGVSNTTANLNGEINPNKAATRYWFEYGKTADLGNTSQFASIGDGSTTLPAPVSISGLSPLTTYYFRINAQNQFGTTNGLVLSFKTMGPASEAKPSVTTKSASDISTSTATFNGTVNPNGLETKYWFEYSDASLIGSVLLSTTKETSAGADTKTVSVKADISRLNPRTTHYFRLVAQNNLGIVRGSQMTFKTK